MDDVKPETISYSDVRAELARLRARYDGVIPPAVFLVIRALEVELAWLEHRGRCAACNDEGATTIRSIDQLTEDARHQLISASRQERPNAEWRTEFARLRRKLQKARGAARP